MNTPRTIGDAPDVTGDRPLDAVAAYERDLSAGIAGLDTYLDLAVLYLDLLDFGNIAHFQLSDDFAARAAERFFEVLNEAERKCGANSEIDFWRTYFRFMHYGEPPFHEECEKTAARGDSLVPYFYLYAYVDSEKYRAKARQLYGLVRDGSTTRKRFILSIMGEKP